MNPLRPTSRPPRSSVAGPRSPVALAVLAALGALSLSPAAQAQSNEQRVEVTGSSIKRIEGETALPVQVVTREEIDKIGVTTAAELLTKLSVASNSLTDGASITDSTSGQRGFNSANLRGIGTSSTLVLLNGRRLANFASPGDNSGVDLNNIPAGAIQRVEVLKDGASAIYGTDAIGGVINFITRRDYRGAELSAYWGDTQDGGAGKQTLSVSGGFGDLTRDKFNVIAVLDLQNLEGLRSSQRDWIQANDIPNRLGNLLSSFPVPGNFDITTAQRNQLNAAGGYGFVSNRVNFSRPGCNPPASVFAPSGPGGRSGCTYNYMADTELYPESQKIGFLTRGVLQINEATNVFAEVLKSVTETRYVLSPVPLRLRNVGGVDDRVPGSVIPQFAAAGITGPINGLRIRTTEMGNRTNEVTSDALRVVLGVQTTVGSWDIDAAFNHSVNEAVDTYVDGYFRYRLVADGFKSGAISPTGNSGAAGKAIIAAARVNDEARKSKGTMNSVDLKATTTLGRLDGGEIGLALGAEFRREEASFTPSALLISNDIAGDRSASGGAPPVATSNGRDVSAAYVEVVAPFSKQLEGQFALRHDRYSSVGSTTNPKLGLRWTTPSRDVMVRGSYGTGFRAPSFSELYRPRILGVSPAILPDPVRCAIEGGDLGFCADQWPVTRQSNPDLKPERSRQFSLGAVFEPTRSINASIDYWSIRKTDVISDIGEEIILSNPTKYARFITRDRDQFITDILLLKQNQGTQKTSGVDLSVGWRGEKSAWGQIGARLDGTYVIESKKQTAPGDTFVSNLGKFVNDGVVQRWRHKASVDFDRGAWGLTLSNTFYSSYTDQNTAINLDTGAVVPPNRVKAYSLWDLTANWTVNKNVRLRAGVLNLLDTKPPFSNQAYYFLASYDPTYTDPRGRFFYVNARYTF
jgi:iron complex outermembrane recepter protein